MRAGANSVGLGQGRQHEGPGLRRAAEPSTQHQRGHSRASQLYGAQGKAPHSDTAHNLRSLTLLTARATHCSYYSLSRCSLPTLLTAHTAHCPRCSLLVLCSLALPTLHSLTYTACTAHNQRAQIMLLRLCVTICSLQFQYQGITACRVEMGGLQVKQAGDDGGGSQLFEESEGGTIDLGTLCTHE